MKIFIIQRVSGENMNKLRKESHKMSLILNKNNHNVSCTMLEGEDFGKKGPKEMLEYAFKEIDNCDVLIAIVRSEKRSEGMLMEIGYAFAKNKKIILFIKKKVVKTYLREMTDRYIEFESTRDLYNKMKGAVF